MASAAFAQGGPPYYTNDPGTPGHLNWEISLAYMPFFYTGQSVSHAPDGLVIGHEFTPKLELDMELYGTGTFHGSQSQPTIDFGARHNIHRPIVLLLMAGLSLEPSRANQSYFVIFWDSTAVAD